MIPWRGQLKFRTCHPEKITKYSLLVWMVCSSDTDYISAIWRYTLLKEKKLQELFFQSLDFILAYGTIFTRIIITVLHLLLNCFYRTNVEVVGLLGRVEVCYHI